MNETEWVEPPSLEVVIAKIRKIINNGILVDIWVGPDDRNSNEYILQVMRKNRAESSLFRFYRNNMFHKITGP
jgi:hypothetical protein